MYSAHTNTLYILYAHHIEARQPSAHACATPTSLPPPPPTVGGTPTTASPWPMQEAPRQLAPQCRVGAHPPRNARLLRLTPCIGLTVPAASGRLRVPALGPPPAGRRGHLPGNRKCESGRHQDRPGPTPGLAATNKSVANCTGSPWPPHRPPTAQLTASPLSHRAHWVRHRPQLTNARPTRHTRQATANRLVIRRTSDPDRHIGPPRPN